MFCSSLNGYHKSGHDILNNKIAKCFEKHYQVQFPANARQLGIGDSRCVPDLVCSDTVGADTIPVYFDTTISKNMTARIREKVQKYLDAGYPTVKVLAFSQDLCVAKESYTTLKRYTKLN